MSETPILRIGTRGSPLALAQAHETKRRLGNAFPELSVEGALEIVVIKTTGDIVLDKALSEIGGKGLFTKEIDDAMFAGDIDIAVHSMKDVPTWLPDGIILPCMLEREDPRDAFISNKAGSIEELPQGAVVGSASLRRQAQIMTMRPDLKVINFRGNVQTRLKKLAAGDVDATLLAIAGLNRMDMSDVATQVIDPDVMLPAVGQGAVGITVLADDEKSNGYLAAINHPETVLRVTAERGFLTELDGSCRTPIAAQAWLDGDVLQFRGLIARTDGSETHETTRSCAPNMDDALAMGHDAGAELKAKASPDFFANLV